jgi:hypothetical protein
LLDECTYDGILYRGPHNALHGELASIHHTFCHAKALATILDYGIPQQTETRSTNLPREVEKGVTEFSDIQSWLVSKGNFRATITGYDREYERGTHATGGALSMLWHKLTGPILAAGLSEYRLLEASNMQMDKDPHSMSLTPRLKCHIGKQIFSSSCDLNAIIELKNNANTIEFVVDAHLVDAEQNHPDKGKILIKLHYFFTNNCALIKAFGSDLISVDSIHFYLPVISAQTEKVEELTDNKISIYKENAKLMIACTTKISIADTINGRIFNFVPGFEAFPVKVDCANSNKQWFELCIEVVQD